MQLTAIAERQMRETRTSLCTQEGSFWSVKFYQLRKSRWTIWSYEVRLTNDEHVTRQSVEDPTNRIGFEQLNGTLEEVVEHLTVEVGSGTGS